MSIQLNHGTNDISATSGNVTLNGAAIPSAVLTVDSKTAAYTVVVGDLGKIIRTTSGTGAITLPSCATVGVGFNFMYANETSANITIQRVGSDFMPGNNNQWNVGPNCVVRLVVVDNSASGLWSILQVNASGTSGGVGIGSGALASGLDAVAIAKNTTASSTYSTAIGKNSGGTASQAVTGAGAMALGGSYASGQDSFAAAVANNTSSYGATAANAIAIGYQAKAGGLSATAIGGVNPLAQGNYSTALGSGSTGGGARALGAGSVALSGYASGSDSFAAASGDTSGSYAASGNSSVTLGYKANANSDYAFAFGNLSVASQLGKYVYSSGPVAAGTEQYGLMVLRVSTSGSVAVMTSNGAAAGGSNQLVVASNQVMAFTGTLIGKQTGSANIAAYTITGTLVNNAGTVTMPTGTLTLIGTDSIGLTTAPTLAADNTNKCAALTSGAKAATNIRWCATIRSSELTYA